MYIFLYLHESSREFYYKFKADSTVGKAQPIEQRRVPAGVKPKVSTSQGTIS